MIWNMSLESIWFVTLCAERHLVQNAYDQRSFKLDSKYIFLIAWYVESGK